MVSYEGFLAAGATLFITAAVPGVNLANNYIRSVPLPPVKIEAQRVAQGFASADAAKEISDIALSAVPKPQLARRPAVSEIMKPDHFGYTPLAQIKIDMDNADTDAGWDRNHLGTALVGNYGFLLTVNHVVGRKENLQHVRGSVIYLDDNGRRRDLTFKFDPNFYCRGDDDSLILRVADLSWGKIQQIQTAQASKGDPVTIRWQYKQGQHENNGVQQSTGYVLGFESRTFNITNNKGDVVGYVPIAHGIRVEIPADKGESGAPNYIVGKGLIGFLVGGGERQNTLTKVINYELAAKDCGIPSPLR